MNKIYRIVQYIQPWEIDDFERQIDQLIKSNYILESPRNIILDVTLNLNIVNWSNSKLPREYFLEKFKCLETRAGIYFSVEFDTDEMIQGCTDKRRSIKNYNKKQDYIIWLDSDVYFSIYTLYGMVKATESIQTECYILSPQLIKYWDASWDCLVAERFMNESYNHRDYFDMYSLDSIHGDQIEIKQNNMIKFGGGWFNLFTTSVFEKIPIPDEIGPYGPDDTYISYCGMKSNIPQYIISGIIVSEVGKLHLNNSDYIKPHLDVLINTKEKISDAQLHDLIVKF